MKHSKISILLGVFHFLLASCSNNSEDFSSLREQAKKQTFTVVVESVGELFSGGEGVNPTAFTRGQISSVAPTQTFDKLALLIIEYASPAKVVYKRTIDNWSNPDNKASYPWSTEEGQGRYATVTLTGDECLEEGKNYMAYVIGYHTGTYGGYEPFKGIEVGDYYNQTEVVTVPEDGSADEIFAGAEVFFVKDGVILSQRSSEAEVEHGLMVARRQVAGTFGYFTRIPVTAGGKKVAKLRLVSTKENRTVIFGGFRSVDDNLNFHKDNVINGMNPATDYDCVLAGSLKKDAFSVYEIDLCKWFPGNTENALLPLDANGDGYLDSADTNWQTDEENYPKGTISLPRGTVFGDSFMVSIAMFQDDVDEGIPTFQMQTLDADGNVVKYWDVVLRNLDTAGETRTLVSLPNGVNGRTEITELENIDTDACFSIVRNRLYTMGEKNQSQNYGEDEPIDLSKDNVLVLDARHEWQIMNSIIFN
ncbi:hypothetical protein [uncultured Bacteroides sp.]|jgi:hypothetical protein|uniref:hypothetical protein n=1 Tax=uncultured Bacteroides sp. TaxID=162156 RepID=UPI00280B495C|nr:hypothetical protein [uncultured Bacteroides sp.]